MFFFFKRSSITLDCFTNLGYVYDYAKIERAAKFYPEWWKNTPKVVDNFATIRNCQAFKEFYNTGFIVPAPFSAEILILDKITENGDFFIANISNRDLGVDWHPTIQFKGFALDDGFNIKLMMPWRLKTNKFLNFVISQPTWSSRSLIEKFTPLPGVVNYYYQRGMAINFFVTLAKNEPVKRIEINPLQPLTIMHPMTEKKVIIRNHLVDDKEFYRQDAVEKLIFGNGVANIISKYRKKKKIIDDIHSCPFKKG